MTVIWLDSCRLIEVMKSMPSMPESDVLEHLRDLRLDDRGTRAGIVGLHGDDRRVDGRVFAHAQALVADTSPTSTSTRLENGGEDGTLDREFGERHGR